MTQPQAGGPSFVHLFIRSLHFMYQERDLELEVMKLK